MACNEAWEFTILKRILGTIGAGGYEIIVYKILF